MSSFFFFFLTYLIFAAAAAAKSLQSCLTLCDPIHGSPPGSPVPGILQARTLEWVAISFSNALKVKNGSEVAQSCLTLSDPMDCSPPGSSVHGIFQYWSGVPHAQSYSLLYHEFFVRHNIYLNTRYHEHYNMVFFSVNKFVYHILSHSSCVLTAMTYCSDFVYLCTSWSTDQTQLMTFINYCYLSMFHGFYLAICFWNNHS